MANGTNGDNARQEIDRMVGDDASAAARAAAIAVRERAERRKLGRKVSDFEDKLERYQNLLVNYDQWVSRYAGILQDMERKLAEVQSRAVADELRDELRRHQQLLQQYDDVFQQHSDKLEEVERAVAALASRPLAAPAPTIDEQTERQLSSLNEDVRGIEGKIEEIERELVGASGQAEARLLSLANAVDDIERKVAAANEFTAARQQTSASELSEVRRGLDALSSDFRTFGLEIEDTFDSPMLFSASERPADAPQLFSTSLVGGNPDDMPLLDDANFVDVELLGRAYRMTDAAMLSQRGLMTVGTSLIYRGRWSFRRAVDPLDPINDAVRIGIAWYGSDKQFLSTTVVEDVPDAVVDAGRIVRAVSFDRGDVSAPAAARYMRAFIQTFGTQTLDVESASLEEIIAPTALNYFNDPQLLAASNRPGDSPQLFTTSLGGGSLLTLPVYPSIAVRSGIGRVASLVGPGIVAQRSMTPFIAGEVRECVFAYRRHVAADPANDAVRLGVQWYDHNRNQLSQTTFLDDLSLSVGSGVRVQSFSIGASAGEGVDFVKPPAAVYFRLFLRTFGSAATVTDAIVIAARAEADAFAFPADGLTFIDVWNADLNEPEIPSASEENRGYFYIVGVSGATDINGISDWQARDRVVSNGSVWRRVRPTIAELMLVPFGPIEDVETDTYTLSMADFAKRLRAVHPNGCVFTLPKHIPPVFIVFPINGSPTGVITWTTDSPFPPENLFGASQSDGKGARLSFEVTDNVDGESAKWYVGGDVVV